MVLSNVQARALVDLSFYLSLYSTERSLDAADRALRLSADQDPVERLYTRAACAFRRLVLCGWNDGDAREFVAAHGEAGSNIPARRADSVQVCMFRWLTGHYRDGVRLSLALRTKLLEAAEAPSAADFEQVSATISTSRLFIGDWGDAIADLSIEMESARKNDSLRVMFWLSILRAWVHLHALDFKGVIEICLPFAPLLRGLEGQDASELPPRNLSRTAAHGNDLQGFGVGGTG